LTLSYAQFANVFYQGRLMNDVVFSNIDSNNPDLTAFRNSGAKLMQQRGLQLSRALREHHPELSQQAADAVDARRAVFLEPLAQPVHAQHALATANRINQPGPGMRNLRALRLVSRA